MAKRVRRGAPDHPVDWSRPWVAISVCAAISLALAAAIAAIFFARHDRTGAAGPSLSVLRTNQDFIEQISKAPPFDVEDATAVFRFVFRSLPDAVRVYPTENYYYFKFFHGGIEYAGNLRLAASDRDRGILHFAYFVDANASSSEGEMRYVPLSREHGVSVEKAGGLEYVVGYEGKRVRFRLNDLSAVKPPPGLLRDNEVYIGPVFDESGLEFFLLFNPDLKIFHYVLNETGPRPEQFMASNVAERIVIGKRTGFAFYLDHHTERKVLIGVHAANVIVNNYYDGPFDQLPDNFNNSDTLKEAIEASDPSVKGMIDRFGYFSTGEGRYLIGPYLQYSSAEELLPFDQCASDGNLARERYGACLAIQGGGS